MAKALVLAGGGVAGIAWLLGAIEALANHGVALADADLIVGTSAGSVAGTQLATDQLAAAVAMQERADTAEIAVNVDLQQFTKLAELSRGTTDELEIRRRLGAYALTASSVSEAARRVVVAARLPVQAWPTRALKITAVDAHTGELVVFDRASSVELVDAVAASCAVPGVWPPVTIGAHRYCDGGTRSFTNADLARGCDRVAILVPVAMNELLDQRLARERAELGDARTFVLAVDAESAAAIGPNPLDPARRKPALDAGRRQGSAAARELAAFWA